MTRQQIHRLREHRLADEERRVQFLVRSAAQGWCSSAPSKNATSGPVSTMAAVIAAEACHMLGVRRQIGNSGIDHPPRVLHQVCKVGAPARLAGRFQDQPQPLLDEILDFAAAQRCLSPWLGGTNRQGLRRWSSFTFSIIKPYNNIYGDRENSSHMPRRALAPLHRGAKEAVRCAA